MSIIVCPGIHDPILTQHFLKGCLGQFSERLSQPVLVFPTQNYPAYSAVCILQFLQAAHEEMPRQSGNPSCGENELNLRESPIPLVFISFSAGVVGAIGAAWMWQMLGGTVKAFIAFDGWGVPLWGNFPIHRLSHDEFTHWSSALLGGGSDSFYAEPPVDHLDLWGKPQTTQGWWVRSGMGAEEQRSREASDNHPLPITHHPIQCGAVQKAARSLVTTTQFLTMLLERYGEL